MLILLVAIHVSPSPQSIPLANAFLKSYQTGSTQADLPAEISLRDFFVGQAAVECAEELLGLQPGAVGFSMYLWNRALCLEIARELKGRVPGLTLFAGGPEVTADLEGLFSAGIFDFLIVGEGELPFAAVCERLARGESCSGIPGVVMPGTEAVMATLADLDTIPSPWLDSVLDPDRYRGILWQLSRGCSFSCDFCFDSRNGQGVRRFSLERIEAELRFFAEQDITQVFVLDSTFNQDIRRAKTILRLIRKIAPHIHFHFEVRSEFIDREMARLFAEVACSLQIGLQSSNPRVLQMVSRVFNRDDFAAKAAILNESGAVFGFDLIYGLPDDTLSGFIDSLDFALSLYPNHLDIFPLALLPGTALAARADDSGLRRLPEPPYTLISSPTFSAGDMQQAARLAVACDIFYTRGRAVAWFNAVMDALGMKPSAFLQSFGEWLKTETPLVTSEADLDDHEVWQLQRAFLTGMFSGKRFKRLLPLALDLADYHYHYGEALQAVPPELPTEQDLEKTDLLDLACVLSHSTRCAVFNYEILEILEAGEVDLREFSKHFSPTASYAAIYPLGGEVRTESLIEPYFRLIEQMDGRTPNRTIVARLGIPSDDAESFLVFALIEGLIAITG